ncbi:MAG: hypothetical protein NTX45_29920 [Proteobacteria bacterium]|nr:hypothetical protein [Pseudomonadota bacterium]
MKNPATVWDGDSAWFKNSQCRVTQAQRSRPSKLEGETGSSREDEVPSGNGRTPEPLEAGQFQPMRMLFPGHESAGAFAHPPGPLASCEGAVIQEEARQIQTHKKRPSAARRPLRLRPTGQAQSQQGRCPSRNSLTKASLIWRHPLEKDFKNGLVW